MIFTSYVKLNSRLTFR